MVRGRGCGAPVHLDPVPFDHLAVREDSLQFDGTLLLLDGLQRCATTHGVVNEHQRFGRLECGARFAETILRCEVPLGYEDLNELRAVDVLLERIYRLEIVHLEIVGDVGDRGRSGAVVAV